MDCIIQNAVKITENGVVTYLISVNRHHYNRYTFDDGSFISVDGGNDYIRRGFGGNLDDKVIECFSLSENSPRQELTKKLLWVHWEKMVKDQSVMFRYTLSHRNILKIFFVMTYLKNSNIHSQKFINQSLNH
jgi:hypothetical protein